MQDSSVASYEPSSLRLPCHGRSASHLYADAVASREDKKSRYTPAAPGLFCVDRDMTKEVRVYGADSQSEGDKIHRQSCPDRYGYQIVLPATCASDYLAMPMGVRILHRLSPNGRQWHSVWRR